MKPMRWFRLYAETISNPKLKLLAFEDRWHYIAVCCLKCSGLLQKDHEPALKKRMIATQLGLTVPEADEMKRRLAEVDLIGDDWQPKGWDKYQFTSDNCSERVKKHREKQKKTTVKRRCNVTVTPPETETETETETERPRLEYICPELEKNPASGPVFMSIPLIPKDGFYPITGDQLQQWVADYPGIDVKQEIVKCKNWNIANPSNRKTKRGALRHITGWLSRAQDRARGPRGKGQGIKTDDQGREYVA
jgi:hypothetical protein